MGKIHFYKYQATGNDFVMIDNREGKISLSEKQVARMCDRKFGIGADGVIIIEKDPEQNFKMTYINPDGTQSLCGNGCRSAVDFASHLGMVNGSASFLAYDGVHEASRQNNGLIRLAMNDVKEMKKTSDGGFFLNTGSPHYVRFVSDLKNYPVFDEGRKIRYAKEFEPTGANANFVEPMPDGSLFVRTYERGVENETLSCGTGVTAVALAASMRGYRSPVAMKVLGGELSVAFDKSDQNGHFHNIFLIGPAKMVFEGDYIV